MPKQKKKYSAAETNAKAKAVAHWLDEKKARDIVVLDVSAMSSIAEAVVIATAQSVRHGQALADTVMESLGRENRQMLGMEGYRNGQWILVDLNDVVVHIFQEDVRRLFNLEGLWSQGKEVDWSASGRDKPLKTPAPVEAVEDRTDVR